MLCAHQIWFLHARCMRRVPTHWPLWLSYPDLKYFQAAQKAIISGYACVCSVCGHLQRPKLRFEQTPNKSSGITLAHAMQHPGWGLHPRENLRSIFQHHKGIASPPQACEPGQARPSLFSLLSPSSSSLRSVITLLLHKSIEVWRVR